MCGDFYVQQIRLLRDCKSDDDGQDDDQRDADADDNKYLFLHGNKK